MSVELTGVDAEAGTSLRHGHEGPQRRSLCASPLCLPLHCFGCVFGLFAFFSAAPIGLGALLNFTLGRRYRHFGRGAAAEYAIIGHRGQPMFYPENRPDGFRNLPSGIPWEFDLQPPNSIHNYVYVEHDPVDDPNAEMFKLDDLLALAAEKDALLMPEIKGDVWRNEDIPPVARLLCNRSEFIQTFYFPMIPLIKEGCPSAKISCLFGFTSIPLLWSGGPPAECDAEVRPWLDAPWVKFRRLLAGEARPLGFFTIDSILQARAVAAVAHPAYGIFSDNAPGFVGEGDTPDAWGSAFLVGTLWFTIFFCPIFVLMVSPPLAPALAPKLAAFQQSVLGSVTIMVGFAGMHLIVLFVGYRGDATYGFMVGSFTSPWIMPFLYVAVLVANSRSQRREG